ncbi:MAG: LptE family protein [Pirellulales bacterium]
MAKPGVCCAVFLTVFGCASYHVGTQSLYPADIYTVHVPVFDSESFRRHLGERLTEAVIKEIESTTPYKVVGNPAADSVLSGRIVEDRKRVLVENRFDDAREIEASIYVQVSWVRRGGQLIAHDALVPVDPALLDVMGVSSVVPETGQSLATAHQKAIQRLAKQIVGMMEAPW